MYTRWIPLATSILLAACDLGVSNADPISAPDRDRDVPNLLRKHCTACHGPDVQEAELRLDSREKIANGSDSGAVIDSESVSQSKLLLRVRSSDPSMRMPPEGSGLSEEEIIDIENWIRSGMPWSEDTTAERHREHWAFQPLHRPKLPAVRDPSWLRNPIDSFVLSRLESENYQPAEQADETTLIRRLNQLLIGLPPRWDDLHQSLTYGERVDQLLASPFYGERWARHWLDVVRFAESDGFETNQPRPNAWQYRDYVIRSFNADIPFDRFAMEQIAGDQLGEDAATGFLVGGAWDRVKSPDPVLTANQRADELHDMVSTTGSTFLGLTIGCARCHSHKFDPISQHDYYAIKASLSGVQHGERPIQNAERQQQLRQLAPLREQLVNIDRQIASLEGKAYDGEVILVDDSSPSYRSLKPETGNEPHAAGTNRGERDQSPIRFAIPNIGKQYRWYQARENETIADYAPALTGEYRIWISWGAGWETHAQDARYVLDQDGDEKTIDDQTEIAAIDQRFLAIEENASIVNRSLWSGFHDAGVHRLLPGTRLLVRSGGVATVVTADTVLFESPASIGRGAVIPPEPHHQPHLRPAVNSFRNTENVEPVPTRFLRFSIAETTGAEPCIDEWMCFNAAGTNLALQATCSSTGDYVGNTFHQLQHINDGKHGNEKSWISNQVGKGCVTMEFPTLVTIHSMQWSRDGSVSPKFTDRVITKYTIESSPDGVSWRTIASHRDRVGSNYPHRLGPFPRGVQGDSNDDHVAAMENLDSERARVLNEIAAIESQQMAYAGRFETPQPTYRLHRGDPMQPRESVAPAGLEHFGNKWSLSSESSEADRRLALAKWIASRDNPLTARVIVNRLWHYHFGVGLVDTPSDFGINGGSPSHPELLDWLAMELIENGWSVKHIQRLIVTSTTFRQSSRNHKQDAAPLRLLSRFPSRRMEAETMRDHVLYFAGTLRLQQGGVGFDLFEANTNYVKVYNSKQTPGPDTWRRMVYQSKPRMQLESTFGPFDCPDAGQSAPKRNRSVTPLQALSLFNSPFTMQQSEFFASRLTRETAIDPESTDPAITDSSSPPAEEVNIARQVQAAFQLAFLRTPDAEELRMSIAFIKQYGISAFCRALLNSTEWMVIE